MPVAMIDKILKHSKKASRKDLEKDWAEAKNIAKDSYGEEGDKTWGTATKIFKNKIKSHYGIDYGKSRKQKINKIL